MPIHPRVDEKQIACRAVDSESPQILGSIVHHVFFVRGEDWWATLPAFFGFCDRGGMNDEKDNHTLDGGRRVSHSSLTERSDKPSLSTLQLNVPRAVVINRICVLRPPAQGGGGGRLGCSAV